MTFREVLVAEQHMNCDIAIDEIGYLDRAPTMRAYREMMQDAINRCYVLGEVIDSLPEEIANREV